MDWEDSSDANRRAGKGQAALPMEVDNAAFLYLPGLPSRGYFSAPVIPSNPGGIRVYVCDHETAPPEGQLIKTNTTDILIRALQNNKQKGELNAQSRTDKRSGRTSEGRSPPKKLKTTCQSPKGSSSNGFSEKMLQTMTVERLRSLLKDRGLSPKGKKDELIARLKDGA